MNRMHRVLAGCAAVLSLGAAAAEFHPGANLRMPGLETQSERDHVSAIELAERIIAREPGLRIFDLRPAADFAQFHIPSASRASLDDLTHKEISRDARVVLYSEDPTQSARALLLMRKRGIRNVSFLREGLYEWISRVHEPRLAVDATSTEREEFKRAAEFSRFFGGVPLSDVARSEVPVGYWTGVTNSRSVGVKQAVENIRRRGC